MAALRALLIVVIAIAIVFALYYFTVAGKSTNTAHASTITVSPKSTSSSSTSTVGIQYGPCNNFELFTTNLSNTVTTECYWGGGPVGIWVSGGITGKETATITGVSDNIVYVNQTSAYPCVTYFTNLTLPNQYYTVSLTTGAHTSSGLETTQCYYAYVGINQTLSPPAQVYQQVYNGGFSDGKYTGWTVNDTGFGTKPLNITYADTANVNCYLSAPWRNYNGTYFATTFNCGLSNAPGNITSSPFYARLPFLNFQIISPDDKLDYIQVLYNGTPYITAWYNTYNVTISANSASLFQNASIPLVNVINKPIQIRVVARTLAQQRFIAVGDFRISSVPVQSVQPSNITFAPGS